MPSINKESIFIWGGSTAAGHHAVQLTALSGLRVFVAASPTVHSDLKRIGAEACFDYNDPDIVFKVKEASSDSVMYGLDTVCERGSTEHVIVSCSNYVSIVCVLKLWVQGCYWPNGRICDHSAVR